MVTFVIVTLKTSLKFVRKLVTCNANQNGSIVLTKRKMFSAEYNKLNCIYALEQPFGLLGLNFPNVYVISKL